MLIAAFDSIHSSILDTMVWQQSREVQILRWIRPVELSLMDSGDKGKEGKGGEVRNREREEKGIIEGWKGKEQRRRLEQEEGE